MTSSPRSAASPTLYLLCGLSFAGKTTLARTLVERFGWDLVSFDAINAERGLDGGRGISGEEWLHTLGEAHRRVGELLAGDRTVLLDDTHCWRSLRDAGRTLAAEHGAQCRVLYLEVPESELRRRMEENQRTGARNAIDPEVFEQLLAGFEPPQPDEDVVTYRWREPLDRLIAQLRRTQD
jgi:predicted kinase